MNRNHTSIWVPLTIILVMFSPTGSGGTILHASDYNITGDPQAYILDKFQTHNLVMLGTRHKRQSILELISSLIPNLHGYGVTHLGLEICSDQQAEIDKFLQTGDGSTDIEIHSQMDCPEYQNILALIQRMPDSRRPVVTSVDLPKSMYGVGVSGDEYMAHSIAQIFRKEPESKMLAVLGNNHILKKLDWQNQVPNKHRPIRSYLDDNVPGITTFSI